MATPPAQPNGDGMDPLTQFSQAPIEWVETPSARVAVRRFGAGPFLVFVHGWPLSSVTFRRLLPELAPHFTCLLVDVPGGGDTEWTKATDFSWPGQAASLKAVLDALGVERYALYGQDSGAMISRQLVLIDPRAEKLVMTNTEIPHHRPPYIPLFRRMMFLPGTNFFMRLLLRSRWFRSSGMGFGGGFHDRSLIEGEFCETIVRPLIRSGRRMAGHNRFLRGWSWSLLDSMREMHAQIRIPVLMLWGADDPTFPLARGREMLAQFPAGGARLVVIPEAKVFVHEERPAAIAREVRQFLLP